MQQLVAGVDGVENPRIELPAAQPNLEIEVDLAKARAEGIKPGDVRRAEATLLQGIEVGSVFEDQKVFEVIVKGTPETRRNVASVRNLLIDKPDGGHVRLGDVADVRVAQTPAVIKRDAVSRYLDVEADVSGRSLGDVANDIEDRLAEPQACRSSTTRRFCRRPRARRSTPAACSRSRSAVRSRSSCCCRRPSAAGAWRRWRSSPLPVALVGGVVAALIDGAELSLGSLIGLLALFGIAARGSLLLIRHFQHLEREEGETFGADLVRRGARERLAPIVTTAAAIWRWSRCRS